MTRTEFHISIAQARLYETLYETLQSAVLADCHAGLLDDVSAGAALHDLDKVWLAPADVVVTITREV